MAVRRMGSVSLLLCCLVAIFAGTCGKEFVPVFMWESINPTGLESTSSALKKYSTDDFTDFVAKKLSAYKEKPLVIVFPEDNLSLEDFRWRFPTLQNVSADAASTTLIPAVENPLLALRGLETLGYQWQTDVSKAPQTGGVVLEWQLEDAKAGEDRPDFLLRHDVVIGEEYSKFSGRPVVALYTGRHASWSDPEPHRVRRLLSEPAPNATFMLLNVTSILIYAASKPAFYDANGVRYDLDLKTPTMQSRPTYQSLSTKFTSNGTEQGFIEFYFYNSTSTIGYWSLENISYSFVSDIKNKVELRPQHFIVAPAMFSYHCTAKTLFRSTVNTSLVFENFQAQPYMDKTIAFGDAYNCELFFTAPIWSGLFVTSILALIMIWGLVMIMDIRTMDQFDDPKGKTITISATE